MPLQAENQPDKLTNNRTIYDASPGEVFWRNFLAGFGRAMGVVVVYFLFLGVFAIVFANMILPIITPLLDTYMKSMGALQQFSALTHPGAGGPVGTPQPAGQPLIDTQGLQDLLKGTK